MNVKGIFQTLKVHVSQEYGLCPKAQILLHAKWSNVRVRFIRHCIYFFLPFYNLILSILIPYYLGH